MVYKTPQQKWYMWTKRLAAWTSAFEFQILAVRHVKSKLDRLRIIQHRYRKAPTAQVVNVLTVVQVFQVRIPMEKNSKFFKSVVRVGYSQVKRLGGILGLVLKLL